MKQNWLYAAAAAAMLATSCQEAYDLDERLPDGYGTTLYSYLEENGYQNVKRLVDDLEQAEVLQGRGLRTMFIADDDAFARFYQDNKWGVRRYEDLSPAQKKLLLYGSMVDQSIQVMNLSNTTSDNGVVTGNAMRRGTFVSIYDSVPTLQVGEMPDNAWWKLQLGTLRPIVCMKDATVSPLMFLTEPFLVQNRITNDDVNFLFNRTVNRQTGDAYVANTVIVDPNLRSQNGFVHKVRDVIVPLDNMAEMLRTTPDLSQWSSFIERFSIPIYLGRSMTDSYNYEYGTNIDSLWTKAYWAEEKRSYVTEYRTPNDSTPESLLKFDPGWNAFYTDDPNATTTTVAMQKNMAVMLVPSNEALDEYWNSGVGSVLRDCYGSWENVPDKVLAKLLNNNMLNSFVNSVPSKFKFVTNLNKDPMGIEESDVQRVQLASNGAIYVTNKVFSPNDYVSVLFPALVNDNMSIIYWAIEQLEYPSYLNSIDSYYSFFIPTNEALQNYLDPASFSTPVKELWHFYYDPSKPESSRVWASRFAYDMETGEVTDSIGEVRDVEVIKDRFRDILNNHIVIGDLDSGREYYKTKNGNIVRVLRDASGAVTGVQGSVQDFGEAGRTVALDRIYDQSREGNGKSYILAQEPVLATTRSVLDVIAEGRDSIFMNLLMGSELFRSPSSSYSIGNIASFNNYNYTVYVPVDEAMKEYLESGDLKTWEQIAEMENDESIAPEYVEAEKEKINSFLRYHIQDNAVYLNQEFAERGSQNTISRDYETAAINSSTLKFYTVRVDATPEAISLTDKTGHKRRVLTDSPALYNLPARELSSNSFAVVHKIDKPLFYQASQCEKYNK